MIRNTLILLFIASNRISRPFFYGFNSVGIEKMRNKFFQIAKSSSAPVIPLFAEPAVEPKSL
jgi:hypothetical protein